MSIPAEKIEAIRTATETIRQAQVEQFEAMTAARAAGATWPQIAEALGVSPQAARERLASRQGIPLTDAPKNQEGITCRYPTNPPFETPKPRHPVGPASRYVAFTHRGPHDLGGAEVTHADPEHCPAVKHFWGQYIRPATPNEIATMRRCKRCG
jgi:hypothetical protein